MENTNTLTGTIGFFVAIIAVAIIVELTIVQYFIEVWRFSFGHAVISGGLITLFLLFNVTKQWIQ